MKILERYILKENLGPFLVSLLVITFVMMLDFILDLLNLVIEKHVDVLTVLTLFGLSVPYMLALSVPMSVLTASIMSFGRFSVDNELVAFKSCGINVYSMLKPLVGLALLLSLFMIHFNNAILPDTNHRLKNLLNNLGTRRPVTVIKPGVFTDLREYTIYTRDRVGEELRDIVIYDKARKKYPDVITAKRGKIILTNNGNSLRAELFDGQMHSVDVTDEQKYQTRTFQKFVLNLPDLGFHNEDVDSAHRTDRELSAAELKKLTAERRGDETRLRNEVARWTKNLAIEKAHDHGGKMSKDTRRAYNTLNQKQNRLKEIEKQIRSYRVEYHKKFAIAFACLVFVLIGAPVGMMTRTSGVGMAFTVSSLVFLVYYVTLIGGEELADRGYVSPVLAMWISNFLISAIGIIMIITSVREQKFFDLNRLRKKIAKRLKL
jgi:lipopolysaccharide export system permease protein